MAPRRMTRVSARAYVVAIAVAASATLAPAAVAGTGDANGSTFLLTGFDAAANVLSGTNDQGSSFTAPYDGLTSFRLADLSRYASTDPCRTAAADYNQVLAGEAGSDAWFTALDSSLSSLASSGCYARVISSRDPRYPTDPIRLIEPRALPPSPV